MAPFEMIAAAYFAGIALGAAATKVGVRRRLAAGAAAVGAMLLVLTVARSGDGPVRAWIPHLYLVAGYWLPGLLAPGAATTTGFERWLVRSDESLRPRVPGIPPAVAHLAELAYLLCYPLVPASLGIIWGTGTDADVSRFWSAVLPAGYSCYVSLPWLVSRPPRLLHAAAPRYVAAVNVFVLGRVSHQLNTFPSGHVAVSAAAALTLLPVSPIFGAVVAGLAALVAIGAAAGRYHYVIDVLLGIGVAAAAAGLAALL